MRDLLVENYKKALEDYKIALNQENECFPEYLDLAIENVKIAKERLNLAIKRLKEYDADNKPKNVSEELLQVINLN